MRLLAAVVLTAALLAPAAPARAATPASFFGVMADGPLLDGGVDLGRETGLMRDSGVGSMRVAVYWRDVEPRRGEYDFGPTDRVIGAAAAAGLDVLPVVVRAPAWATGGDTREGAVPDSSAYAEFVATLVRRYGPGGTLGLPRPVRSWQVWNEPDIDRYWRGSPWPTTYVALLRAARDAIKVADPGARVVAAGLTNRSWEDLGALYRAGARGLFDAAAIHPFSARVRNVVRIAELARRAMNRAGGRGVPLLLTEITWTSGLGEDNRHYGWETTERGQAQRLQQALAALAAERKRLNIGGVWWYTWLSPPTGTGDSFSYAGLRRMRDGRPVDKPERYAFRRAVQRLRAPARQRSDAAPRRPTRGRATAR